MEGVLPSQQWLDILPDAVIIVEQDGRIAMLNDKALEMFGYGSEELLHKPVALLIPELLASAHAAHIPEFFENPNVRHMGSGRHLSGRRKDGSEIPAEISISPFREGGKMLACAVIRDVEERRRVERVLQDRQARLDLIFNSTTDILVLLRAEPDGGFVTESLNRAAISYLGSLGYNGTELEGKDVALLLAATGLSEAEIRLRRGIYQKTLREKAEVHFVRGQDQSQRDAMEIQISPVVDHTGRATHLLISARVVTDWVNAEAALREREERLRLVFNAHQDPQSIIRVEAGGTFVNEAFNQAQIDYIRQFLPDPKVFLEQRLEDLHRAFGFSEEDMERSMARWRLAAAKKTAQRFEVVYSKPRREVAEVTIAPILNQAGECTRLLWTGHFITERKNAEEELRRRERELAEAQRIGHIGSWSWEVQENTILWSDEVYRILGFKPQEFPPISLRDFLKMVHPDDRERTRRELWAAFAARKPHDIEHRIIRPDGSVRFIHTKSMIQTDAAGQPIRLLATVHDVTEEREAAARDAHRLVQLKQLSELSMLLAGEPAMVFEHLVRMIGDLFQVRAVCLCEIAGRDLLFRAVFEKGTVRTGAGRSPLEGSPCADVLSTKEICIYDRVQELFPDALFLKQYEARSFCAFPSFGSEGTIIGVTYLVDDKPREFSEEEQRILHLIGQRIAVEFEREKRLAEQARMEEKLRENQRILEEAQRMAHLGSYYSADAATGEMEWSPELYRIYEEDPAGGKPDEHLVIARTHPADRDLVKAQYEIVAHGAAHFEVEHRLQMPDGRIKHVLVQGTTERDPAGKVQLRGTVQDITERKLAEQERGKLQEQLAQAQRLESIGRLAGGVAHDFNNMLTVILGYAALCQESVAGSKLEHYLTEITKAATRSQQLTEKLLGFSRRQIIAPVPSDLNFLLADLRKPLARLIGEDIELEFNPGRDLWTVVVDHSQVNQILLNLAVNARDAMPHGGKLTIETKNVHLSEEYCRSQAGARPGPYVVLAVSDTGVGMDEETVAHIFEPFFTTKERDKGTGLGLATVYGIVKQNEGFVNVETEPNKGTTFKIYLPIMATTTVGPEPSAGAEAIAEGHGTILLVEDDELVREMTKSALESIGYTPVVAATPLEAIALCAKMGSGIRLMLTDVVMPGMNGMELRERIQVLRPGIKVLFMSGYTSNVIVRQGVLKKGVHFIQKPFTMEDLARRLAEVLAAS
jgi:two-component system, cell cycle sensor histidine kinase and response regulator CckA